MKKSEKFRKKYCKRCSLKDEIENNEICPTCEHVDFSGKDDADLFPNGREFDAENEEHY